MAITEHESGSQTATIDTVHTLNATSPETTDGVFQFFVDIANLANGDIVVLTVEEKCRSGDTARVAWRQSYPHNNVEDLAVSPAIVLMHGWNFKLEQTDGTGRAFPWSIRKIA